MGFQPSCARSPPEQAHKALSRKMFERSMAKARKYCEEIMEGTYGEGTSDTEDRRRKRKRFLRQAVTLTNFSNMTFDQLRSTMLFLFNTMEFGGEM